MPFVETARSHAGLFLESHTLCFSETWQSFLERPKAVWQVAWGESQGNQFCLIWGMGWARLCAKGSCFSRVEDWGEQSPSCCQDPGQRT